MERPSFSLAEPLASYTVSLALPEITSLEEIGDPRQVLDRLKTISWDFVEDKTGYLSHDLHPYPAKFIPQIPANVIGQLSVPGELVWDPFGGSGTTALEALLLERRTVSSDANPLATVIGRAKTTTLTLSEQTALRALAAELSVLASDGTGLRTLLTDMRRHWAQYVPPITHIEKWFAETSVKELAYARHVVNGLLPGGQQNLCLVALSRAVQKISFQDSETRYSSKPRKVRAGETLALFAKELVSCLHSVSELGQAIGFRHASFATSNVMDEAELALTKAGITKGGVDLVVTSPPYPNATDYHLYHRFRMFWLGYDPREFAKVEIGSHLRHQRHNSTFDHYLSEMAACLRTMHTALRPGRYAVLVLGDGVFKGKTYHTAGEVGKEAGRVGFEVVGTIGRAIHATRRSFAVPARRAREEQLLVLRKPDRVATFLLQPPNYKMHAFEEVLREAEVEALLGKPTRGSENTLEVKGDFSTTSRLRQLVFSHQFQAESLSPAKTWQAVVENGREDPNRRKKESNYWLHGVHPYKGKFYPQLAGALINQSGCKAGAVFLDPFCGSGTSVIEAMLRGHASHGSDLNPLAVRIARVKAALISVSPTLVDNVLTQLIKRVPELPLGQAVLDSWISAYSPRAQEELRSWFPEPVLQKLAAIFREIRQVSNSAIQEFLEVVVSGLVRDISQQEPSDLRIRRRETPLPDADVLQMFRGELQAQYKKLMRHYQIRNAAPAKIGHAKIWEGDCRALETYEKHLAFGAVDLIVTSPPYATALPYIDTYRLSHLLLFGAASSDRRPLEADLTGSREIGLTARSRWDALVAAGDFGQIVSTTARRIVGDVYRNNASSEVGFRKKNQAALLYRYFEDMTAVFKTVSVLLKPKGQMFVVIGNNFTQAGQKEVLIDSVAMLKETGGAVGLRLRKEIPISVTRENLKHQKNTITENAILWFERS